MTEYVRPVSLQEISEDRSFFDAVTPNWCTLPDIVAAGVGQAGTIARIDPSQNEMAASRGWPYALHWTQSTTAGDGTVGGQVKTWHSPGIVKLRNYLRFRINEEPAVWNFVRLLLYCGHWPNTSYQTAGLQLNSDLGVVNEIQYNTGGAWTAVPGMNWVWDPNQAILTWHQLLVDLTWDADTGVATYDRVQFDDQAVTAGLGALSTAAVAFDFFASEVNLGGDTNAINMYVDRWYAEQLSP